ncbi:MAG: ATP synthase F0 subunit B [Alphaproteobacteria bacterium]|nr:MAG: ATP synthase F0 subunit B [Alphaproteobacteria bacterium]
MLPQFDVATFPSQFFWLTISFSIVLGGMVFLVLPKYKKMLSKRLSKLKNEVDTAVYLQQEVITLKKEKLKQIEEAQEAAKQEIEEAYQKIHHEQVETIKAIKKEHELMIKKLEKSIEQQKQNILEHVKPFIAENKDEIISKIQSIKGIKDAAS